MKELGAGEELTTPSKFLFSYYLLAEIFKSDLLWVAEALSLGSKFFLGLDLSLDLLKVASVVGNLGSLGLTKSLRRLISSKTLYR
jgi:hypothetical protein